MYHHYNRAYDRDTTILHPGEYYATRDEIIISTVLGSCVAVALYDPVEKIGGLNHFMLPGELHSRAFYREESGRYGMYAMELLINSIIKQGGIKKRLEAKVFGGGHVLDTNAGNIPDSNIAFALDFLESEKLPVISQDVGGNQARKVLMFPESSRILLKRFGGKTIRPIEREEAAYLSRIQNKRRVESGSNVTFFN